REGASIGAASDVARFQKDQPGAKDNLAAGVTQWYYSLPGVKQASSAIEAASDDKSNLSFSKKYRMALEQRKFEEASIGKNYPVSSFMGEAASLITGGGAISKGVTKIPKVGLIFDSNTKRVGFGKKMT